MTTFLLIIIFLYTGLCAWFAAGHFLTKRFTSFAGLEDKPVTIIISARNEEKKMEGCLRSLLSQVFHLNLLQILITDDGSTDETFNIAQNVLKEAGVDYEIVRNQQQLGKKISIQNIMEKAKHDLIITRDADTITQSPFWLKSISSFAYSDNSAMVIGPIAITEGRGLLWALQAIENNILGLFAAGSAFYKVPFLCSGANLAFKKEIFLKTGGYKKHLHIPSGDDVLFMEQIKKEELGEIRFLRSPHAIVQTYAEKTLRGLLSQKIRWSGKVKKSSDLLNLFSALIIVAANSAFLLCIVQLAFTVTNTRMDSIFVCSKLCVDILLLFLASSFTRTKNLWWYAVPVSLIYPLYAVTVAIGAAVVRPSWKGKIIENH